MTADFGQLRATLASRGLELGDAVAVHRTIEAASDRIWEAISQPGHLERVHPFCRENAVQQWPGVGATDTITYYSGVHYQRDFVTWYEGEGYDLEIGPPPDKTARVSWRIQTLEAERSELGIEVTPYLETGLSASRKGSYQRRFFGDSLVQYLDSVVKGVDHLVTTGQAVRKNQFGSHPFFSDA